METPGYQNFIQREFSYRNRRNPRYSLRAFARDLRLSPSRLSEILSGRCGISRSTAERISSNLKFSESERVYFVSLVQARYERSRVAREAAEDRLRNLETTLGFGDLALDKFRVIADWYHFAILELTEVTGFSSDPAWIARRLGIPKKTVNEALDRLARCGLLSVSADGTLQQSDDFLVTSSDIPSRELREHHAQILEKAASSLEQVPVGEREFGAMTMSIPSSKMADAKRALRKFQQRFCKDLQGPDPDRVYCLSVQFFPLDRVKETGT